MTLNLKHHVVHKDLFELANCIQHQLRSEAGKATNY